MIFQDPLSSLNPVIPIGVAGHRGADPAPGDDAARPRRRRPPSCSTGSASRTRSRRLKEYPHQLSGGMRQRALIAMALACQPRLLIADEPTTALDVTIQAQILELLKELVRDSGTALVMITHDLGVVAGLCDTVNVLYARPGRGDGPTGGRCSPSRGTRTPWVCSARSRGWTPGAASRCTPIPGSVRDPSPGRRAAPSRRAATRRIDDVRGRAAGAGARHDGRSYRCVNPDRRVPGTVPRTRRADGIASSRRSARPGGTASAACPRRRGARRSAAVTESDILVEVRGPQGALPDQAGRALRPHGRPRQGRRRRRPEHRRAARRTGWWASPAAASPRSAGRCSS